MGTDSLLISPWAPLAVLLCLLLFYIIPYFYTYIHLRRIPGPLLARFSNIWLLYICRKSKRSDTVYNLHEQLGPVVRIQPNHVSIVDERAISLVYGHGNGLEKSSWYDSSISLTRSIFTARNRAQHARKRRYIAHSFAPKSSRAAEGPIANKVELLVRKWDEMIDKGPQFDGFTQLECRRWFTYLSFDITGDLLFSEPFGMLENGSDLVKIDKKPGSYVSMMNSLAQRSAAVATLGVLPWLKPHAHLLPDPFFHKGMDGLQNLLGVTSAHVRALPYLDAVLNETMRLHSVLGIGLPREVLPGSKGVHLDSFYFPPSTVLSVPIYAIHRSRDIWGQDANEFRPERWEKLSDRQKTAFMPFGHGPAACVGRNLAEVEMKMIAATLTRRYNICVVDSQIESTEGTTRKILKVNIGIKRR
ncbi:hypothetical protein H9Q72_009415 [Fusarium xylarioides]|uniref:Cytochrome P450 monooxygenase n=1 Tax=Fusarium xylarioides TaxID=221167 RepID=A0A9P7L665_9HYPO|nr:hypothetical protein H9Q72_009415 [Fusarium xylarioides]